jgi:RHS repeat-associated protein
MPTAGRLGPTSFTVLASDGKGSPAKLEVPLRVIEAIGNRAPSITLSPRKEARTGTGYLYKLTATDPDGDPTDITLISAPLGMTVNSEGLLAWTPQASQVGPQSVSVSVSDGQSGTDTQSWIVNVSNSTANRAPSITSVPDTVTNLEKVYRYQLAATDPDGDYLLWCLDNAPKGMVFDAKTGSLSFSPAPEQVGEHTVAVRVSDALGSYVGQEFSLKVTGINTPPAIVSTPVTVAAVNGVYRYQPLGTDPENDALRYSLGTKPEGMKIDQNTGAIEWTPGANFVGSHEVSVLATDTQGAVGNQRFAVQVGTAPINQSPTVISTPVFAASLGSQYSYFVQATDPEGGSLTYQLLKAPPGMAINAATGLLTWDNPTAGNHQIAVGAVDAGGLGAAQGFTLTARANSAPVIPTVPAPQSVATGATYRYDLKASDAESDLLSYSLVQSPSGMTVDEFGRISWVPKSDDVGTTKPVQIAITDTNGLTVTVAYSLSVVADTAAPKVNIIASKNTANVGDSVTFTVNAVDNVKVASLGLTINGTPVVLDAQGQANVKVNNFGNFTAVATALDAAGNAGTATQVVAAIDTSDVNAPTINISLEDDAEISEPVKITGTINDSNLAYYTLEVAPVGGGEFKEVYRGTTAVNNGTVATFDPTVLANGAYTLKFTAIDANGNGSTTERTVNVAGDLKLGNFRLSFTDLTVPVAGIPISVTRTYDSLNANATDDFGYGWRMEFRDTDLKTSLKADPTFEELGINTVPFDRKTKVFITLPGGKRETFTFKPTPHHLNQYLGGAGPGAQMYKPAFESQKGSTMTLTVKDANLVRNDNGEYYGVNGQPFNPENPAFGGIYVLTTKEGLVYEIDAASGDLLTATDANGNKLTFSDAGIKSSAGKSVTFERDAEGRIVSVVDPDGKKVKYEYDAKGDLVAVKDREENPTQFKYEDEDRPHFLTEVIDPLGRSGVKTDYDEQGRLKQMVDANGSAVGLIYDPNNSIQKVKDVFEKETTYVYDSRGNVLTEIDPLGKRIDRTYDADNNVENETVITTELNAAGNPVEVKSKTEWTYDNRGNKLTEKDALGNVSRWTYNSRGQILTETDALGNTATYTYSPSGNLLTAKDAKGNVTKYNYDLRGNILSITDATNNTTNFQYNAAGDATNLEDSSGNKASYIYDSNGNRRRETMTVLTPTGPQEFVTEWTYNNEGQIKSVTQGGRTVTYEYEAGRQSASIENNRRTEYRYNSEGKLVETIYPDDTPSNSDNSRSIAVYDKGGRQRATIDSNGRVTHYKYDDAGRLTETVYPNETANQVQQLLNAISPGQTPQSVDWTNIVYPDSTPAYLANNSRTKTEYYKTGEVKAEIDVSGNRTEYEYDAAGRVSLTRFDTNNYITYTYDAVGNRKTETVFAGGTSTTTTYDSKGQVTATTDQNGKTTQFEYDANGQLKAVVDALQKRTEYTYDSAGNLTSVKDALGQVTTYEYDEKGRRKAIIRPDNKRSTVAYNDAEKTVTITDFNNKTVKYTYNDQNQVVSKQYQNESGATVSVTYTSNGLEETITDSRGATVYKYDNLGQLISRKDPTGPYLASGNSIEYTYEGGQVSEVKTPTRTIGYTYDYEGRLRTVSTPDLGTVTYDYDSLGNLWKTSYPNNLVETRTYDGLGRLDVVKTAKIDPVTQQELQVISSYDYAVDHVGNRQEVVENNGRKVEYKYDDLNRLWEEKVTNDPSGNNRVVSYTYDAVGNRLTKTDSVSGVTTYTYNGLNQLDFLTANGVLTDYSYDSNGNLISEVTGSNSTVYRWANDGENRLMGVTVNEGGVTRNVGYQYNAQGIRVGKVVDGVETRYLIDELQPYAQVVEEYDAAGNPKGSYVYGYDLVGKLQSSQASFYHADGLGSTRLLTNGLGGVTDSYAYDAYGNLIASTGASNNAYLFGGEQRDSETGLDYLRARYYDPLVGRFVSADAYEGSLNDPMSLHDYQYAHANPVVNTDPSGYMTLAEVGATIGLVGILAGLGLTTVGAIATLATGGSLYDAVSRYDQLLAGFAEVATFGLSTRLRSQLYGETATRDHRGIFFNLGRFTGGVVGFGLGFGASTALSGLAWAERVAQLHTLVGAGVGSYSSTRNIMEGRATAWDILPFLPLIGYGMRFPLDWAATRGAVASDLEMTQVISNTISRTGPITPEQYPRFLQPNLIGRVSKWWLDLRNLIILYRGQRRGTTPILSPLAREQGIEASENLVRRMRAEGLSDPEIAGYTARWHTEPVPPMFAGPNLGGEPLGAVGIPTTRLPGLASAYAGSDGVTFVLRLPKETAILPRGWQGLAAESEYVILNQVPNQNIVQVIPARYIPKFDVDEAGNIIIPRE